MESIRNAPNKLIVWVVVLSLGTMGFPPLSGAVMIGTQAVIDSERQDNLAKIDAMMTSGNVRKHLEKMGVDPESAKQRVAALSDSELAMLRGKLEELPAGSGLLAVIGIVFVVLIILELIGVIDIFKKV